MILTKGFHAQPGLVLDSILAWRNYLKSNYFKSFYNESLNSFISVVDISYSLTPIDTHSIGNHFRVGGIPYFIFLNTD